MKYSHNTSQVSLFNFESLGFNIPKDNHLVQLAEVIDWEMLVEKIKPLYATKGRKARSIRMMIGLEIAKAQYKDISDEELVKSIQTDTVLMYFCGFSSPLDLPQSLNSSTMTKFRNRLTPEVLQSINEEAIKGLIKKLPKRKRGQVASDTTVLPANIAYPTDTAILGKVSKRLDKAITQLQKGGIKIVNRGKQTVNKTIVVFNKIRRKTKEQIRKVKRVLIRSAYRKIKLIKQYASKLEVKTQNEIKKLKKVVDQQMEMYKNKTKRIKERIVSIHEEHIRPMYRGKNNAMTEFGKKVSMMMIGQSIILPNKIEYNNFSDTNVPKEDLKKFEEVFGRKPNEYAFDRGGHSPENHNMLEENKIKDGIQYRGKIPLKAKRAKEKEIKRMHRQRTIIEGKIGTLKTRYGLSKIRYKAENTQVRWHIGILIQNMRWAVING